LPNKHAKVVIFCIIPKKLNIFLDVSVFTGIKRLAQYFIQWAAVWGLWRLLMIFSIILDDV